MDFISMLYTGYKYTMQILKVLGTIYLIFITGIAVFSDENLFKEPICIKPVAYNMNVSMNIQNNSLDVVSNITIDIFCRQKTIRLTIGRNCDMQKFNIDIPNNVNSPYLVDASPVVKTGQFNYLYITLYTQNPNGFTTQKMNLYPRKYHINYEYNCSLDKVVTFYTYVQQSKEKKLLILPRFPAEWIFPYWKSGTTKATFTIHVNHNDTETALSHMPSDRILKQNTFYKHKYTSFPITRAISTHLAATVVVPYECVSKVFPPWNNVILTTRFEVETNIKYAKSLIIDITDFIRHKVENVIPASYVQYVALPINSSCYETIVTTGLVLFRETDILYDENVDSFIRKKELTCLIARSVIQEMFSDWLATFKQSDPWFIEGFSTVYGVYIISQTYNESLLESIVVHTRREFLDYTEVFMNNNLSRQENLFISRDLTFSKLWGKKAFSTFYMIDDIFYNNDFVYNAIFELLATNLYISTRSRIAYKEQSILDSLWNNLMAMPHIYENIRVNNESLTKLITSWMKQIGYPVVQVTRNNNAQSLTVMVRDCYSDDQEIPCEQKWWIPMTYVKLSRNQPIIKHQSILNPDGGILLFSNITEDDYIIIMGQHGYRVNYDRTSWKNIALFLKKEMSKTLDLSDITLAQILDDAFYFLVQNTDYNEISLSDYSNLYIFFDLASNLLREKTSFIVWYPAFNALEYISKIFPFPESANIKDKLLEMMDRFLDNKSHDQSSKNSDTNHLYHEILKWICILDGLKCKEHVNTMLKWHLHDSTKNKLLPSWQKWIYCQGLMFDNITYMSEIWQTLLNVHQIQSKQREMFEFLTCATLNRNITYFYQFEPTLRSVANKIAEKNNFTDTDTATFLFNIIAKHSKSVASLTTILRDIEERRQMFPNTIISAIITCIINHTYLDESLLMVIDENFLKKLIAVYKMPPFVIDAIKTKAENRRIFLSLMRNNIRYSPHNILNYKGIKV